jgi:hypothetical protein
MEGRERSGGREGREGKERFGRRVRERRDLVRRDSRRAEVAGGGEDEREEEGVRAWVRREGGSEDVLKLRVGGETRGSVMASVGVNVLRRCFVGLGESQHVGEGVKGK